MTAPPPTGGGRVWGGVMVGGVWDPGWVGWIEGGAACGVALEPVAVGAGPLEHAGSDRLVVPGGVGLESVVVATECGEVRGRGRAGLLSAFGFRVVVVLDDVVDVATPRGSGAPGEDAGAVAEDDLFAGLRSEVGVR